MLKKMKIGTKLAISFGAVWIIVIGLVIGSITSISKVSRQIEEFYDTAHSAAVIAWQARRDVRLLESSIYKAIATPDKEKSQIMADQATESATSFNEALVKLKDDLPEKSGELDKAIEIAKATKSHREDVLKLAVNNEYDAAMYKMTTNYAPQLEKIIGVISEVGIYAEEEAKGFVDAAAKTEKQVKLYMIGVGILVAIFILMLTKGITRSIAIPAKKISDRIVMLANGDLKTPMPVIDNKDEIGVLAQGTETLINGIQFMIGDLVNVLTQMAEGNLAVAQAKTEYKGDFLPLQTALRHILVSLNSTLSQINIASDEVSSGANQVSNGAQALAQGATEQASAIEELSASILDISIKVNENAENADKANEMAKNSTSAVTKSNEEMQNLANAINEINNKSKEIGKIIKTIEDIAFQTNILALNAAVEAARAGVAGKGFAVVADEVRNLASKSSEAAKYTTALIGESIEAVENGTRLAKQTANNLVVIVEGANKTTKLISKLTAATDEQAIAIKQINIGIDQISAVVQTNSATSDQSAASSEELSGQADILKGLVQKFKLKV